MASYEYVCLACEHRFEERRPIATAVITQPACPSCGDDRVRRRFSFVAARPSSGPSGAGASSGCACGGACGCGR